MSPCKSTNSQTSTLELKCGFHWQQWKKTLGIQNWLWGSLGCRYPVILVPECSLDTAGFGLYQKSEAKSLQDIVAAGFGEWGALPGPGSPSTWGDQIRLIPQSVLASHLPAGPTGALSASPFWPFTSERSTKFNCMFDRVGDMRKKKLDVATLVQRLGTKHKEISVLVPGPRDFSCV